MKPALDPIVDMIIASLEQGVAPWRQTWETFGGLHALRHNKVPFTGLNQLTLSMVAAVRGYSSTVWLTYNQARELGAQVRRGERSTPGCIFKPAKKDEDEDQEVRGYVKVYPLFNADQCDNVPQDLLTKTELPPATQHDVIELIAKTGMTIVQDGRMPHYQPLRDEIHLPPASMFESVDEWVGTLLHEAGHGTGHKNRLARQTLADYTGENRVMEELIAEIFSLLIATRLNIPPSKATQDNHLAYIGSWAKLIRKDRNKLSEAVGAAQRAVDYFIGQTVVSEDEGQFPMAA